MGNHEAKFSNPDPPKSKISSRQAKAILSKSDSPDVEETDSKAAEIAFFRQGYNYDGKLTVPSILREHFARTKNDISKIVIFGPAHVRKSEFVEKIKICLSVHFISRLFRVQISEIDHDLTSEVEVHQLNELRRCDVAVAVTDRAADALKWIAMDLDHLACCGLYDNLIPNDAMKLLLETHRSSFRRRKVSCPHLADFKKALGCQLTLLFTDSEEEIKIIRAAAEDQTKTLLQFEKKIMEYGPDALNFQAFTDRSSTQFVFEFDKLFIRSERQSEEPKSCCAAWAATLVGSGGYVDASLHEVLIGLLYLHRYVGFLSRALWLSQENTFPKRDAEIVMKCEIDRPNDLPSAKDLMYIMEEFGLDAESLSLYEEVLLVPLTIALKPINKIIFSCFLDTRSKDPIFQLMADLRHVSDSMWKPFQDFEPLSAWLCRRLSVELDPVTEQFGLQPFLPKFLCVINKENTLGRGAQGCVRRCSDIFADRHLAVKILEFEESAVSSPQIRGVIEEFRRIHNLAHKNLAKYYALDLHMQSKKYHLCIFMEFCNGGTLKDRARRCLSQNDVIGFTRQIVEALTYLHEKGILHLDLKGENILLTGDNIVKVCDFGMSHKLIQSRTKPGEITSTRGTYVYMAPEMVRSKPEAKIGRKCDIWSFGCLLLEMLTGKTPKYVNSEGMELDAIGAIVYYIGQGGKPCIPQQFLNVVNQTDTFKSSIRFVLNECLQPEQDLRPTANELKSCSLLKCNMVEPGHFTDVAVTGIRASGKSFLIDNLRGLTYTDKSAAPDRRFRTGPLECHIHDHTTNASFDPIKNPHYFRFWEINASAVASSLDILSRCAAWVIASNAYFSESDYEIAKGFIENHPTGIYLVHTKCEDAVRDQKLDGNQDSDDEILETLRTNIGKLLPPHISSQTIYMIDNRDTSKFDFELFRSTLFMQLRTPPPEAKEPQLEDLLLDPAKILVVGERGTGKSCLIDNLTELGIGMQNTFTFEERGIDFTDSATHYDSPDARVVLVCCKDLRYEGKGTLCTKLRNTGKKVFLVKTFATEDLLQRRMKGPLEMAYLSREEIFSQVRPHFVNEMDLNDQPVYFIDNYENDMYDFDTLRTDLVAAMCTPFHEQAVVEGVPSC